METRFGTLGVPLEPRRSTSDVRLARVLLWAAFACFLAGVGLGTGWDRRWHATHPFEDFWSPPHLFIYTNVLVAAITLAYAAFAPCVRAAFGAGFCLPPFTFA